MVRSVERILLFVGLLGAACVAPPGPLPEIAGAPDRGFPTTGRQPTPLADAVIRDDLERVTSLLAAGADPDERWGPLGDRFPLQEAIHWHSQGHLDGPPPRNRDAIIRALLEHGANPNARYCHYETRVTVLDLLVHPPGPLIRPCHSRLATTVLMSAVLFEQAETVSRLLDAGADATAVDYLDQTALDLTGDDLTFRRVIDAAFPGADGERRAAADLRKRLDVSLDWIAGDGQFRLWPLASFGPRYGLLRLLVTSLGVHPKSDEERRALGWIMSRASWGLVELMVERGVDLNRTRWCQRLTRAESLLDPSCRPEEGVTPLMRAAYAGRPDRERWLIDHGADPELRDWRGRTAADYRDMSWPDAR
jgi:hypothetical protein